MVLADRRESDVWIDGGVAVTMPPNPHNGHVVRLKTLEAATQVHANTGQTFEGDQLPSPLEMDGGVTITLQWSDAYSTWFVVGLSALG
jgi:hypothetical protein